jgi:hypothetical protein
MLCAHGIYKNWTAIQRPKLEGDLENPTQAWILPSNSAVRRREYVFPTMDSLKELSEAQLPLTAILFSSIQYSISCVKQCMGSILTGIKRDSLRRVQ